MPLAQDDIAAIKAAPEKALFRTLYKHAPDGVSFRKLRKRLLRQVRQAISDYHMLPPRDTDTGEGNAKPRWLVCLSGGKDSYTLLALLLDLKAQGLLPADLLACNLDQGQPGFPKDILPDYLEALDIPYRIETRDTYSIVTEKIPEGKTYCSLCSRLRRGHLYRVAREENCTAVVLGHHRDDALETFLLNLFHGGRLAAMPPKLVNDDGDLHLLRPLILSAENDIAAFARGMDFPIIPCNLCGSQDGLQRVQMKKLLNEWEQAHPGRRQVMFRSLQNIQPSQLADSRMFNFRDIADVLPATDISPEKGSG